MADLKISQLTAATALAGTEVVPVVQSGTTKKATIDQILAPAAGKGIDFSANGGDLLSQYDEGTWTPVLKFAGATTGITYSAQTGKYTRVGRLVAAYCKIELSSKGSASGAAEIYGLPFTLPGSGISVPVSAYINEISYTGSVNFHAEGTTDRIALQQVSEAGSVTYLNDSNFTNTSAIEISISYMV